MSPLKVINITFLFFCSLVAAAIALAAWNSPQGSTDASSPGRAAIVQLTHESGNALRPAWSPDNRHIVFESNREGKFHIYIMNANGSGVRSLTPGDYEDSRAVWTPDGNSILYTSSDGLYQNIWLVDVATGTRKQLTHLEGAADYATVSPDGAQLVFYFYKDMTLNLWIARADGSDAKPLTRDLADARRKEHTLSWHQAGWSPDSRWLTFTGGDGKSIWVMGRDGRNAHKVISDGETNHFPWFLADGRLAFITEYVPPKYGGAWTNAWAYDLKTGERTLIQEYMSMQGPVDWSADGSRILFSSPRAGHFDLYLIDLNVPGGIEALRGNGDSLAK